MVPLFFFLLAITNIYLVERAIEGNKEESENRLKHEIEKIDQVSDEM